MSTALTQSELQISVLVVEDENLTRALMSKLLTTSGFRVVGSAPDAASAMVINRQQRPQVAVIDINLGAGPSGLDLAHALRKVSPRIGIVFVTVVADARTLGPNLPEMPPASLYINKAEIQTANQLIDTIQGAYALVHTDMPKEKESVKLVSEPFTDLQIELMRMISLGMSNASIAAARFTTVKSTENAIARLAKKLNIASDEKNNQRVSIARAFYMLNFKTKLHE